MSDSPGTLGNRHELVNQLSQGLEHWTQVSISELLQDKHVLHLRHPPTRNSESSTDNGMLQVLCRYYFINKSSYKEHNCYQGQVFTTTVAITSISVQGGV